MRITLFTSNGLRHLALIERFRCIASSLFVVMESRTLFPGEGKGIYHEHPAMREYFKRVQAAEREVFKNTRYVQMRLLLCVEHDLILGQGDVNHIDSEMLDSALQSDLIVVYGASYIKGWLCDALVERKAINLHMGIAPEYRGADCNFWALYDRKPQLVGATIHRLSSGLDSGPILRRVFARADTSDHSFPSDPFSFGMEAVRKGQQALVELVRRGGIHSLPTNEQDKSATLRYTRYSDFTPEVVREYLASLEAADA